MVAGSKVRRIYIFHKSFGLEFQVQESSIFPLLSHSLNNLFLKSKFFLGKQPSVEIPSNSPSKVFAPSQLSSPRPNIPSPSKASDSNRIIIKSPSKPLFKPHGKSSSSAAHAMAQFLNSSSSVSNPAVRTSTHPIYIPPTVSQVSFPRSNLFS